MIWSFLNTASKGANMLMASSYLEYLALGTIILLMKLLKNHNAFWVPQKDSQLLTYSLTPWRLELTKVPLSFQSNGKAFQVAASFLEDKSQQVSEHKGNQGQELERQQQRLQGDDLEQQKRDAVWVWWGRRGWDMEDEVQNTAWIRQRKKRWGVETRFAFPSCGVVVDYDKQGTINRIEKKSLFSLAKEIVLS